MILSTVTNKTKLMKKLLLLLAICLTLSCKKDLDKKLSSKNWRVESVTVSPAMTSGNKTSTDYLELMGPQSCAATTTLTFSDKGIFTSGSNGALCDLFYDPNSKPITWTREGEQITISSSPQSPFTLKGNKLTRTTTTTSAGGTVYTFEYVYKAQ